MNAMRLMTFRCEYGFARIDATLVMRSAKAAGFRLMMLYGRRWSKAWLVRSRPTTRKYEDHDRQITLFARDSYGHLNPPPRGFGLHPMDVAPEDF